MNDVRLKLSPPWITYINKLEAMFDPDPLIAFNVYDDVDKGPSVTIATADGEQAAALVKLLPEIPELFHERLFQWDVRSCYFCQTITPFSFGTMTNIFSHYAETYLIRFWL